MKNLPYLNLLVLFSHPLTFPVVRNARSGNYRMTRETQNTLFWHAIWAVPLGRTQQTQFWKSRFPKLIVYIWSATIIPNLRGLKNTQARQNNTGFKTDSYWFYPCTYLYIYIYIYRQKIYKKHKSSIVEIISGYQ